MDHGTQGSEYSGQRLSRWIGRSDRYRDAAEQKECILRKRQRPVAVCALTLRPNNPEMQFRRKSDSLTYTLFDSSLVFAFALHGPIDIGLIYYGVSLIIEVSKKAYFLQTSSTFTTTTKQAASSFPDMIVCTDGIIHKDLDMGVQPILDDPAQKIVSPCGSQPMYLLSAKTYPGSPPSSTSTPSDINQVSFGIEPMANQTGYIEHVVFVVHKNHPLFNNTGLYGSESDLPDGFYDSRRYLSPNYTITLEATPKETTVIEDGILGLFGSSKDKPVYGVTITGDMSFQQDYKNWSIVILKSPTRSTKGQQILLTSIPNAFSAWGGAFSTAWGLFYFVFGSGRLDPFGIFTTLFLRRKAKKYLIHGRYENDEDNGDGDDGEKKEYNGYGDMASHPTMYEQPTLTQDPIVQKQGQHIRTIEEDLHNLKRLLKDYYLDMDLISRSCEGCRRLPRQSEPKEDS